MDERFCVSPSNCAVLGSALHAGDQAEERAEEGDVGRGPGETRRGGGMDFGSEGRVGCLRGKGGPFLGEGIAQMQAWEQARMDLEANE